MTAASLTVHNAEVRTATVEIRTLTVSGKQVTLAVFRQLKSQPLIQGDGTLAGQPWGVVNYHPDKCGDDNEHLHVVWQSGTELRRAAHSAPSPQWMRSANGDALIQALYCENGHRRPTGSGLIDDRFHRYYNFKVGGLTWFGGDPVSHNADAYSDPKPCPDLRSADLLVEVNAEAAEEIRCRERELQSWQVLTELPQLFIAV